MGLLRVFLACELTTVVQDAILSDTAGLRAALGRSAVRWVPPHNIHLTLKFFGDIAEQNLGPVEKVLTAAADRCPAFDANVEGIGAFPSSGRPRVLWVGLNAPPSLSRLRDHVELACTALGYEPENRAFSPHLTIGRVRPNISTGEIRMLRDALLGLRIGSVGKLHVEAIHLFRSDLQPTGSIYTRLLSIPLGKA